MSSNYIYFRLGENTNQQRELLYSEVVELKDNKQVLAYDKNSDKLYARDQIGMLDEDIVMTLGHGLSNFYFYKESQVDIANEMKSQSFTDVNSVANIDGKEVTIIGLYQSKMKELESFSYIINISSVKEMKTVNYVDFYNRSGFESAMSILKKYNVDEISYLNISFFSLFNEIISLRGTNRMMALLLGTFIIIFILLESIEMTRDDKEYKILKKIGVSNRKIILEKVSKIVVEMGIVALLATVSYYFISKVIWYTSLNNGMIGLGVVFIALLCCYVVNLMWSLRRN